MKRYDAVFSIVAHAAFCTAPTALTRTPNASLPPLNEHEHFGGDTADCLHLGAHQKIGWRAKLTDDADDPVELSQTRIDLGTVDGFSTVECITKPRVIEGTAHNFGERRDLPGRCQAESVLHLAVGEFAQRIFHLLLIDADHR